MNWVIKNVGVVSIDEVIFHLKVPLEGTSQGMINDFIRNCIVPTIMIFISIFILFQKRYKYKSVFTIKIFNKIFETDLKSMMRIVCMTMGIFMLVFHLINIDKRFKIVDYLKLQMQNSK